MSKTCVDTMDFFNHPNTSEAISILSKDVALELKEFDLYCQRHKRKLQIVHGFVVHSKQKTFQKLKAEIEGIENLTFLDLGENRRQVKYNQRALRTVCSNVRTVKDVTLKSLLYHAVDQMKKLNSVYKHLRVILKRQQFWLKKHENSVLKEHEGIKEFLRLLREENTLLYSHNLTGDDEQHLLIEIYNYIMPLKDRVSKVQDIKYGAVGVKSVFRTMDGEEFVLKRIGRDKNWTQENAIKRVNMILTFYQHLKQLGVPLPPPEIVHAVVQTEINHGKISEKGFQTAIKQKFYGLDCRNMFIKERDKSKIARVYNKLLEVAHLVTEDTIDHPHWIYDLTPSNFCVDANLNITFIDIDPPPLENQNFDPLHPSKMSSDQLNEIKKRSETGFLRRFTVLGVYIMIMESSNYNRPNLQGMFVDLTLKFLKSRRPILHKRMQDYLKNTTVRDEVRKSVK